MINYIVLYIYQSERFYLFSKITFFLNSSNLKDMSPRSGLLVLLLAFLASSVLALMSSSPLMPSVYATASMQRAQFLGTMRRRRATVCLSSEGEEVSTTTGDKEIIIEKSDAISSLDKKMASWEATEEEKAAATLGGLTPGKMDSFDIGLAIAFPFIVGTCLLFLLFPFIGESLSAGSRSLPAPM